MSEQKKTKYKTGDVLILKTWNMIKNVKPGHGFCSLSRKNQSEKHTHITGSRYTYKHRHVRGIQFQVMDSCLGSCAYRTRILGTTDFYYIEDWMVDDAATEQYKIDNSF